MGHLKVSFLECLSVNFILTEDFGWLHYFLGSNPILHNYTDLTLQSHKINLLPSYNFTFFICPFLFTYFIIRALLYLLVPFLFPLNCLHTPRPKMHTPDKFCTRGVHTFWQKGVQRGKFGLLLLLYLPLKTRKALAVRASALYQNCCFHLVEARGIEPLSEGRPAGTSTGVASGLFSRRRLPGAGSRCASTVIVPGVFGCANRETGSLISRRPVCPYRPGTSGRLLN